jgi:hypothetical protein
MNLKMINRKQRGGIEAVGTPAVKRSRSTSSIDLGIFTFLGICIEMR